MLKFFLSPVYFKRFQPGLKLHPDPTLVIKWGLEYTPPAAMVLYATAISSGVVSHDPSAGPDEQNFRHTCQRMPCNSRNTSEMRVSNEFDDEARNVGSVYQAQALPQREAQDGGQRRRDAQLVRHRGVGSYQVDC